MQRTTLHNVHIQCCDKVIKLNRNSPCSSDICVKFITKVDVPVNMTLTYCKPSLNLQAFNFFFEIREDDWLANIKGSEYVYFMHLQIRSRKGTLKYDYMKHCNSVPDIEFATLKRCEQRRFTVTSMNVIKQYQANSKTSGPPCLKFTILTLKYIKSSK